MAHETIDLEKLIELIKSGAEVRTENKPTIIAQVDPSAAQLERMIGKLDDLVKTSQAKIEADHVRSEARGKADIAKSKAHEASEKRQLEVLQTLQSLIRSGSVPKVQAMDLTPLKSVLSEIRQHSAPKGNTAYRFKVERTSQGFIDEIIATPVHASSH